MSIKRTVKLGSSLLLLIFILNKFLYHKQNKLFLITAIIIGIL